MANFISSKRDVYIEIADRYEKFIKLGIIKEGEKLPSVRAAAGELKLNPNTVGRAYSLLEERGLISSIPKKGAFVISRDSASDISSRMATLTEELLSLKEKGVEKEKIILLIEEVYRND